VNIPDPKAFLRERSPVDPSTVSSSAFLEHLYCPGECLIVFNQLQSTGEAIYTVGGGSNQYLPSASDEGISFLVQPVTGREHFNPRTGYPSRRSEEAVTSYRYLLLESDEADLDEWLRAYVQLPLPTVSITSSGGRSIHCLVLLNASSKEEWTVFKNSIKPTLVTLGADPQAMTAVRLSRLPQCHRDGRLQELLYLNPTAGEVAIKDLPVQTGGPSHV